MTTTFDPAAKASDITLSGGNLIATKTADSDHSVRTVDVIKNGERKYIEVALGASPGSSGYTLGICNASFPYATMYVGQDTNSWCIVDGGQVRTNNVNQQTGLGVATARLCMDVDRTSTGTVRFRVDNGTWSTAFTIGLGTVDLYVAASAFFNTRAFTLKPARSDWINTVPTGATEINAVTADGNSTMPQLTQSGAVGVAVTATGATTLPQLTQAASLNLGGIGITGATTLPQLTQSGSLGVKLTGTATSTMPAMTQAALIGVAVTAVGASTLPQLTQAGTINASGNISLSGASVMPAMTQAASLGVKVTGSGATTLPALNSAGQFYLGALRDDAVQTVGWPGLEVAFQRDALNRRNDQYLRKAYGYGDERLRQLSDKQQKASEAASTARITDFPKGY